jgi:hypothetical protein
VDGRQFYNLPFIITPLRNYNIIFSYKFLSWANIKLTVHNRVIKWLINLPLVYLPPIQRFPLTKQLLLPQKINLIAQADIKQKDIAFNKGVRKDAYKPVTIILIHP